MENHSPSRPAWFETVGIIFALSSGLSIILQKKGLLASTSKQSAKEYDYLRNPFWQFGIASMVVGELSNFLAYSFIPAIIVAPLGAISVVVAAILAHFMLKERLSFSGTIGIILCVLGSVVVVLHGPHSSQTETIPEFYYYVLAPGFLVYSFFMLILLLWLVFKAGPDYGETQPVVYLAITSIGGSYLVNAAQGFGSSLIYTIRNFKSSTVENWNQFEYWGIYPLMVFIVCSAIFQINYLNKSLKHFSASIVTPVNYVLFTALTLIASSVLFRGFQNTSYVEGATIILGFLVIVMGVLLLSQYNLKLKRLEDAMLLEELNQQQNDLEIANAKNNDCSLDTMPLPLHDPRTDTDPFSLWVQTFPLRKKEKPKLTTEMSAPALIEMDRRRNTIGRTETMPTDDEEVVEEAVVRTSN